MKTFYDYDLKYPDLIIDILDYFWFDEDFNDKTIIKFCGSGKYCTSGKGLYPQIILKICDILANNNVLSLNRRGGVLNGDTSFSFICREHKNEWKKKKEFNRHYYNSMVYGIEYIYRFYRDKVFPIIAYGDDESMGTIFRFRRGLVTARHCIEGNKTFAIKGYSGDFLRKCPVYVSTDESIDIAYIHTDELTNVYSDEPNVLDDILVMGYPKVPSFLNFLTGEKAVISTIAQADVRMTPTRGSVAALAQSLYVKELPLMLITAKIQGGNSGGPIINNKGCIVGVTFSEPLSEGGKYDDMGYGVGLPISVLDSVIQERNILTVNFIDVKE